MKRKLNNVVYDQLSRIYEDYEVQFEEFQKIDDKNLIDSEDLEREKK